MAEKHPSAVQDMYESCKRGVSCAVSMTEEFKVEVGLHQGSEPCLVCYGSGQADR